MLPNKTLSQTLFEIYQKYPRAIDEMFLHLMTKNSEKALIGETSDETLQRVYKQTGYREALDEIKSWFENRSL